MLDYNARYYDPAIGRFISADSVVPEPGNSQAWNRYSYVLGNPLGYVDPSGHRYDPAGEVGPSYQALFDDYVALQQSAGGETGGWLAEYYGHKAVQYLNLSQGNEVNAELAATQAHNLLVPLGVNGYLGEDKVYDTVLRNLGHEIGAAVIWGAGGRNNISKGGNGNVKPGSGTVGGQESGARPPNLSPPGAGRRGAFRQAKRDAGIPVGQAPSAVLPNVDRRGNVQPGRVYEFEVPATGGGIRTIRIREDTAGHFYGPSNLQNRGSHFNLPEKLGGGHYDY